MKLPRPLVIYALLLVVVFSVLPGKIQAEKNSAHICPEQNIESTGRSARAIQQAEVSSANHFWQNQNSEESAELRGRFIEPKSESKYLYDGSDTYDLDHAPPQRRSEHHQAESIAQKPDAARPPPRLGGFLAPKTGGQFGDEFQDLLSQIRKADFGTQRNGSVFWSGFREGNQTTAMAWAKLNGKKTIEMTTGGKWLNNLDLYNSSNLSRLEIDNLWRAASAQFGRGASGNVSAFTRGVATDSSKVFFGLELKILKSNPKVSPSLNYS